MGTVEMALLSAKLGMTDLREIEAALDVGAAEERRLRRRRLRLAAASAGLFAVVAARIAFPLRSLARVPSPSAALLDWSLFAIALAAAVATLMLVWRLSARLADLRREMIALRRVFLDVLERESAPTILRFEGQRPLCIEKPTQRAAPEPRPAARFPSTPAALAVFGGAVLLALALSDATSSAPFGVQRWIFLENTDVAGLGFKIPLARTGAWVLGEHKPALGARALISLPGVPGKWPALAVTDKTSLRDLQILTRCMVSPNMPEKACGLVFRYLDEKNYYLASIDAVGAVIFSVVVDGVEHRLQTARAQVGADVWQELRVQARGDHFTVEWNGRRVIDVNDSSIALFGTFGLWAPADCVAYFDELEVRPLAPTASERLSLLL